MQHVCSETDTLHRLYMLTRRSGYAWRLYNLVAVGGLASSPDVADGTGKP